MKQRCFSKEYINKAVVLLVKEKRTKIPYMFRKTNIIGLGFTVFTYK